MTAAIAAAAIGAGVGLYGASKSASATKKAAQQSADAQIQAAQIAADEARFRPFDMSNAFGSVDWTYGGGGGAYPTGTAVPSPYKTTTAPTGLSSKLGAYGLFNQMLGGNAAQVLGQQAPTSGGMFDGRVSGVNVTPSAWMQGLINEGQGNYNNYQNLLSQYFNPNLQEGGNQIYNEWQNILAPTRQTQQTNLFDTLQAKGITGIQGYDPLTGSGYNPMANSLFSSWAGADQQMSANSINEYLSRLGQLQAGADSTRNTLTGLQELPLNNVLGLSAQLGGRNANATGSQALLQGGMGAAQTMAQGQVANAASKNSFWQGLGNSISGMDWGSLGGGTTQAPYSVPYSGATGSGIDWTGGGIGGYAPSGGYESLGWGSNLGGVQF